MKQINQFIRKHLDLGIRMDKEEAQSICNDIIEIWDNFSDGYQWQGMAIEPPHEVLVFYAYLKPYYNWVKKYAYVFALQSEEDILSISERINSTDITNTEELQHLALDIHQIVQRMGIDSPYEEFFEFCKNYFEGLTDDDFVVGAMNIFIYIFYCWLYAFPPITEYLIESIEYNFKMSEDKEETDENGENNSNNTSNIIESTKNDIIYKTTRMRRFGDKILLKEFDSDALYCFLINGKYIDDSMTIDEFNSVLYQQGNKTINWKDVGCAAICAENIFPRFPMLCAQRKFKVRDKIIQSQKYSDFKSKGKKNGKLAVFEDEIKKIVK